MSLTESIKRYEEARSVLGEEVEKNLFKELFEECPNLDVIVIRGWTPDFNDGEPCEHYQDILLEAEDDDLNEIFGYDCVTDTYSANKNLSKEENTKIFKTLYLIEDIMKDIYGTNWFLIASRTESGVIEVENGEYDCGH